MYPNVAICAILYSRKRFPQRGLLMKKNPGPSIVLTLLGLAIWFTLGLTFISVELERVIESTLTPRIRSNPQITQVTRQVESDIETFMQARHIRLIGYACLAGLVLLIIAGLIVEKRGLSFLGGIASFLPIYGYYVIHMSFLAGLQILKALWLPFWGNLVKLGDAVYLPYMLLVYPPALFGIDVRRSLAYLFMDTGLLIFLLGTLAWFYARFQKKGTANFWIYRYSRHPQYLGWILWSYGLLLRASQSTDVPLWNENPGASLPWLISTMAIVCVALSEEMRMRREHGVEYKTYQDSTPFMLPLPGLVSKGLTAPLRLLLKKDRPESRGELVLTFAIYVGILMALSLPFVLLDWPPGRGWMDWPLAR
jgi:protein-S-isoprenylcysteine O-methyltransferase Ste14